MFTAGMSHEQLLAALQAQAGEMTPICGIIDQLNLQQQQQLIQQPTADAQGGRGVGTRGDGDGVRVRVHAPVPVADRCHPPQHLHSPPGFDSE